MKTIRVIILAALLLPLASPTVAAQAPELEQEVDVDRDIVPEPRDVVSLNLLPASTMTRLTARPLSYSERPVNVSVSPEISVLPAVAYADSIATAPWRGYVAGGLFPALFNAELSAGYKLLDTDRSRLTAFLQYNGTTYRGDYPTDDAGRAYVRRHAATFDLSLHQAVGRKSFLDAGVELGLERYTMPASDLRLAPQMMRRLSAEATFTSSARDVRYSAGLRYGHFGFGNTVITDSPDGREPYAPTRENAFNFHGTASMAFGENSTVGVKARLDVLSYNRRSSADFLFPLQRYTFHDQGSYSHGLLTLTPYYQVASSEVTLNIGARVDFTFNSGKAFHIAPDVNATWRPAAVFALFAKAGGGEHQNSLRRLFGDAPFAATMMAYGNSHIPLTLDAGMTFGSYRGAWLQGQIGYARANNWLMPVTDAQAITFFRPLDMRGLHWTISAGYTYRSIAGLTLRYEGTQQGYEKGYYLWRDRAKTVVGADLTVKPIAPLEVTLSYELRSGRRMMDLQQPSPVDETGFPDYAVDRSLGRLSDLTIGATWRHDDRLSFFASLNNILCQKYRHIGFVPGQGFNGLLGAAYKF